jgi:hypothetical protein
MKTTPPAIYASPELEELRQVVAGARARLAELEVEYTKEKSRVDVVQAVLFRLLRGHYQKRDRLRIVVDYRRKVLDSLTRGNAEEAKQAEKNFEQAKTQTETDYEGLAAAAGKKQQLTAEQEAELTQLWKKLVKLYHPDRFANEPDKLETYRKLTAAINRAKDSGDITTLREIAEDPQGFMLRQGWASLDFGDAEELTQLRRLHETLEKEIVVAAESLKRLRDSPDYELCQLSDQKPGVLDELAAERTKQIEAEIADLEKQAARLASEINKLTNQTPNKPTEVVASSNRAEASLTKGGAVQNPTQAKLDNLGRIIAKLIAEENEREGDDGQTVRSLCSVLWGAPEKEAGLAASALGKIGGPKAVKALCRALTMVDNDGNLRACVCNTLVSIGPPAVEELCLMLNYKDCTVRTCAAYALGMIGDARAIEPLRERLQAINNPIHRFVSWALVERINFGYGVRRTTWDWETDSLRSALVKCGDSVNNAEKQRSQ